MFDRTVTLYNYHKSDGKWYGSIISGCSLTDTYSSSKSGYGVGNTGSANIHFHCSKNKVFRTSTGAKTYVDPLVYQGKAANAVSGFLTFTPEVDFVVIDESVVDTGISDSAYESGFYDFMNRKLDNVHMITNAAFYNLLPHFVVGTK